MERNWLDIQHRGFSAYLRETAEDASCERLNRAIVRGNSPAESVDTVLLDCLVKTDWIEQIEGALPFIENAVHQNRQFILRQGETVPIERAKRVSRASVEHLSRHSELITAEPQPNEQLCPDKIYMIENIGTYTVYENRFLYMLLCYLRDFAGLRYQKITELAASFSSDISFSRQFTDGNRKIRYCLTYSEISQGIDGDCSSQAEEAIQRIKNILQATELLLRTDLMKEVSSAPMLKPPITRTNVMLHDPNFKAAFALYGFLSEYAEDGYEKLERYRYAGAFSDEMRDDFAALVSMTSYLSYRCGGLRGELEDRFQAEEQRRKAEAERKNKEKLAVLQEALGPISGPAFAYILALEQRVGELEEKDTRLSGEMALRAEAEARLVSASEQISSLQAAAAELDTELRRKDNEIRDLTAQNVQIQEASELQLRQLDAQREEERQRFAEELEQQKQAFLLEYEALAEKYHLASARARDLSPDGEECCTKEAFGELEQEFEAFRRYYERQWKLAKRQIRKEQLWKK